jgi:hypothetical protein
MWTYTMYKNNPLSFAEDDLLITGLLSLRESDPVWLGSVDLTFHMT